MAWRRFDAEFKLRDGVSIRNLKGSAAFRRGIETARRQFDSATFKHEIQTEWRRLDAEFKRRGGVKVQN